MIPATEGEGTTEGERAMEGWRVTEDRAVMEYQDMDVNRRCQGSQPPDGEDIRGTCKGLNASVMENERNRQGNGA